MRHAGKVVRALRQSLEGSKKPHLIILSTCYFFLFKGRVKRMMKLAGKEMIAVRKRKLRPACGILAEFLPSFCSFSTSCKVEKLISGLCTEESDSRRFTEHG